MPAFHDAVHARTASQSAHMDALLGSFFRGAATSAGVRAVVEDLLDRGVFKAASELAAPNGDPSREGVRLAALTLLNCFVDQNLVSEPAPELVARVN